MISDLKGPKLYDYNKWTFILGFNRIFINESDKASASSREQPDSEVRRGTVSCGIQRLWRPSCVHVHRRPLRRPNRDGRRHDPTPGSTAKKTRKLTLMAWKRTPVDCRDRRQPPTDATSWTQSLLFYLFLPTVPRPITQLAPTIFYEMTHYDPLQRRLAVSHDTRTYEQLKKKRKVEPLLKSRRGCD